MHRAEYLLLLALTGKKHPLHSHSWDYSALLAPARYDGLAFSDLPGFTRSIYRRNYAVITPESQVFSSNPLW